MIYQATEEDMRSYSQIVQQIATLEMQKNELLHMLQQWEDAHRIEEEQSPE